MIHPQFHGCSFLVIKLTHQWLMPPCLHPQPPTVSPAPSHLWLIRWELQDPPPPPPPYFPVTRWLLKLGSQEVEEPGGASGGSARDAGGELGQGRGTSSCPGLPSLLASLQSADRGPQDEAIEKGAWTWKEVFSSSSLLPTCQSHPMIKKWHLKEDWGSSEYKRKRRNKKFLALKCTLLVIRAVRFNLFTLDRNKRKWDQLQTSLLWQQ